MIYDIRERTNTETELVFDLILKTEIVAYDGIFSAAALRAARHDKTKQSARFQPSDASSWHGWVASETAGGSLVGTITAYDRGW